METLFIGQNLVQLDAVPSTNTYAMQLLKDVKVAEGTVISADNQTQGKGQRGNTWLAEPSMNLTFSVILYPVFLTASNHFYLGKIAALALYDALAELLSASQHDIKIKWPNDILVSDCKIAGILIENNFRIGQIQQSVVGVGLNVNQEVFAVEGRKITSLRKLLGRESDRSKVLELVCAKLEARYMQLRNNSSAKIDRDYHERLYLLNEPHVFTVQGMSLSGKITGVNQEGALEVESEHGDKKYFEVKEIAF